MTVSRHSIEAWVGTQKIDIIDASISMDEAWSPYVQASLTTVVDDNLIDLLDPRTGGRVHIYISQEYGDSEKLSALTAAYSGDTIADLTTEWTGQDISAISATYFTPFNPSFSNKLARLTSLYGGGSIADLTAAWSTWYLYQISELYFRSYPDGIYNNYRRGLDLGIRSRSIDVGEGVVSLELTSDEALLQDYALVSVNNFSPSSLQLRDIIKEVLALINGYLVDGAADATIGASAALWAPGQQAWDYLSSMVQASNLRLYCDERRNWHLVDSTFTQPGLAELWSVGTIKSADDDIDRNNNEWFDAVVVKYSWVNDLGANVIAYDTAAIDGFTKVQTFTINSNYPGAGAAQAILDRAISRGRQLNVTTVSNYMVEPSMACDIYILGTPTENVYIKAVSWNYPSDEMTVTTRLPVTT